jgi:hypothetical protein
VKGISIAVVLALGCNADDPKPGDDAMSVGSGSDGSSSTSRTPSTEEDDDAPASEATTGSDDGSNTASDPGSTSSSATNTAGRDADSDPDTISDSSPDSGDDECPTPGCVEYAAKMNECYDVAVDWLSECAYVYEVCGIVECLPGLAAHVACVNTSSCDVIVDGGCNDLDETC